MIAIPGYSTRTYLTFVVRVPIAYYCGHSRSHQCVVTLLPLVLDQGYHTQFCILKKEYLMRGEV